MLQSSVQNNDSLQAFYGWRKSAGIPGLGGKDLDKTFFIPQSKLKNYLGFSDRVENLLDAVLNPEERPSVAAKYIRDNYLRTFAILLCIGQGQWISHFRQHRSLLDDKLPYDTEPANFPYSPNPDLVTDFKAEQWQFCAMALQYDMQDRFNPEVILPIRSKEEIGSGGSAIIFKIVVDEAYNSLHPIGGQTSPNANANPHPNTFVLKTYRGNEAESCQKVERNAYVKLRCAGLPPPNIVAFYGSFIHGTSYNLILEYADGGNLNTFMKRTRSPASLEDVLMFFDRLVRTLQGLQYIHGRTGNDRSASQLWNGWHQDIKPDNILVFSGHRGLPYDCEFKIADLGLAHFKPCDSHSDEPSDRDTIGTRAYGAPETYRYHRDSQSVPLQITTAVDIWSLGCVFSEVAVWAHDGWRRVKEYRQQRSREIETRAGIKGEHIFHWDNSILDAVQGAHQNILRRASESHWVVREIVEQLIPHMLRHEGRPNAYDAFKKATQIIEGRAKKLDLPRSSWSVTADDTGAAEHGSSTRDPPQPPPDITPDSSIWSSGRGRSTPWNPRTALVDAVVSSDDNSLSPTTSIHSVGNHRSLLLNRANIPMDARIPTSIQPRPTNVPLSTFPEPAHAGVSAQPRSRREQALPPSLSIAEARIWKEGKKRGERPELPGSENLASLNERDHIFLVDNSGTMQQYRKQVAEVIELLAYIVKASDDDGLDLHFTQDSQKFHSKSSKEMSNEAYQKSYRGSSDMRGRLETILHEQIKLFGDPVLPSRPWPRTRKPPRLKKRLSFYILTDAKWQPNNDVGEIIKDITQEMKTKRLPKGTVGIQFIRFGEDQASIEKLDKLDHGLGLKAEGMDIVDHTHWNDNVWKMLLGALNDWYDDDPP